MQAVSSPPGLKFLMDGLWIMKYREPIMNILKRRALWLMNVWTTHGGSISARPASLKTIAIYTQHVNINHVIHETLKCTPVVKNVHLVVVVAFFFSMSILHCWCVLSKAYSVIWKYDGATRPFSAAPFTDHILRRQSKIRSVQSKLRNLAVQCFDHD